MYEMNRVFERAALFFLAGWFWFHTGITSTEAGDWPEYRGARGNGRSAETSWTHHWDANGPSVMWEFELGTGFSGLVAVDDLVIGTGHQDGKTLVSAIQLETGLKQWQYKYDAPLDANDFEGGPTSTPLIADGVIFVLSRRGMLFALRLLDGSLVWQTDLVSETGIRIPGWGFSGSPRLFGARLVVNVGDAGVCVDRETGKILWASEDRESGYSSAVYFKDQGVDSVILGSARSYVCVDLEKGQERWRQRWLTTFGCNAADPIVVENEIFLSSGYSRGSALLDLSTGEPETVWKHKEFRNQLSTSILVDGFLYGISGDVDEGAHLACMEWETGRVKWVAKGWNAGALLVAGDRLVLLSDTGELIIAEVNPQAFKLQARSKVLEGRCWVSPVMIDGFLLCRNASGRLVCLNLRR